VDANNETLNIAHVPVPDRRLLAKDFYPDSYHGFIRTALATAAFCATAAETGSDLTGFAAGASASALVLIRPVRDMIGGARQDGVKKRIMQEKMVFPGKDIRMPLDDSTLETDVTFIAGDRVTVSASALLESAKGLPGLSMSGEADGEYGVTVNPGTMLGFMLRRLRLRPAHDQLLADSSDSLVDLSNACRTMPVRRAGIDLPPGIAGMETEMRSRILTGALGIYGTFYALEAERVATRLTDMDVAAPTPSLQLGRLTERLRSFTTPMPWTALQTIDQAIPQLEN